MDDRFRVSVQDAAAQLGLSPDAVRKRIADGGLPAQRRGRQWWLDERSVERAARHPVRKGRPLSPELAWAVLLLASGDEVSAADAVENPRYRSRVRAWLRGHNLAEHSSQLRSRARFEEFDAHPSQLPRILKRPDVAATGISAGDVIGLHGGRQAAELYAPAGRRASLVKEHALEPGAGPLCIRWVPDRLWPLVDQGRDGRAPRAAVLVDLLENEDPRARREAARTLAG